MKGIEKYIWFLALTGLLACIWPIFKFIYAEQIEFREIPTSTLVDIKTYGTYFGLLENIVIGVWLYATSSTETLSRLAWTAFGLVFGFWGLAIFYLSSIYQKAES